MKRKFSLSIILTILVIFSISGCKNDSRTVTIFHAGSLSVPMKHLKKEFEKRNPGISVLLESSGSRTAARKISDLHKPSDLMASADYNVIYNLLMPDYTDFNIQFATNEMALVYTEKSRYAEEINGDNWYTILLKNEVQYGHSNPERDPCGYRSQLVWQLAEKHYKKSGLYINLKNGCPKRNIRPKEVDLIALLETGALDYIFLYRSVAIQHKLKYIEFPDQINLGNAEHDKFYKEATIELTGKNPGEKITVKGESMVYGITMVKNPANRKDALAFLSFMLSSDGLSIIDSLGQKPIDPPVTKEFDKIPEEIKSHIKGI